jgi:hypothetical protein
MNGSRLIRAIVPPVCLLGLASSMVQTSEAQAINLKATLAGVQEVPAVLSGGTGEFSATIDPTGTSMTFRITYSGLEADVTQSHIHFGQPGVVGGIMVFFCTNLTPPAGVPRPQPCPLRSGTVEGTVTAADVIGPLAQGVTPANFTNVVSAIQTGRAYANVHSTRSPGGEIRGLVKRGGGGNHDDD